MAVRRPPGGGASGGAGAGGGGGAGAGGGASGPVGSGPDRGVVWMLRASVLFVVLVGATVALGQYASGLAVQADAGEKYEGYQSARDAQDLLRTAAGTGALGNMTLYYQHETAAGPTTWHGAADDGPDPASYVTLPVDSPLGAVVDKTVGGPGLRYNLAVEYRTPGGDTERRALARQGTPPVGAVTASRVVALDDGDVVLDADGDPVGTGGDPCTLADIDATGDQCPGTAGPESFFAPDAFPDTDRYNIVRVEVVVW